jgi:hypothetical protein
MVPAYHNGRDEAKVGSEGEEQACVCMSRKEQFNAKHAGGGSGACKLELGFRSMQARVV